MGIIKILTVSTGVFICVSLLLFIFNLLSFAFLSMMMIYFLIGFFGTKQKLGVVEAVFVAFIAGVLSVAVITIVQFLFFHDQICMACLLPGRVLGIFMGLIFTLVGIGAVSKKRSNQNTQVVEGENHQNN